MLRFLGCMTGSALTAALAITLIERATQPARLFAAAYMAGVRLIDNIDVPLAR